MLFSNGRSGAEQRMRETERRLKDILGKNYQVGRSSDFSYVKVSSPSKKTSQTPSKISDMTILDDNLPSTFISTFQKPSFHHDIFLDGEISRPQDYRAVISLLFNAGEEDVIHIFINSDGGDLDTALAIIEGLKGTQAHVVAILIGACHSAASIISLYCHEVVVLDNAYSMIHTASFGTTGNTGDLKTQTAFIIKRVEKVLDDAYEGFLTADELLKIKQGMELWFDAPEIRAKIIRRVKVLEARAKKIPKINPV